MLRILPKILLVSTAFAPVLLTMAAMDIHERHYERGGLLLGLTALAVIACLMVMHLARKNLARHRIVVKSIKPADKELVGFVLAYLLPLARGSLFEGFPLLVVLTVFFLVIMTSNAYHTNPLLGLLGWHFYEVVIDDVGYVLVSRRNLHNVRAVKDVVTITEYMILDGTPA